MAAGGGPPEAATGEPLVAGARRPPVAVAGGPLVAADHLPLINNLDL